MLTDCRAYKGRPAARFSLRGLLVPLLAGAVAWCAPPEPAAWRSIGPFGGGSEVVAIDPSAPNRIYTLTTNAFLYRSEDEGRSWKLIRFPAQQAASAHALVINPGNPQEIWIAVSSGNPQTEGIYRTTNGGSSWHHLDGLKGLSVFSLALFGKDSQIVAAGARDGVYLTRDQGKKWERISPLENKELQPVMSLAFDPRDEKVIYAGTPHLPWKTENAGATWRSIHKGMLDDSDILSLIVNPNQPTQLFIGACSGIYRTDNSAGLWTKMLGITGAGYRTYSVAQDLSNPKVIFSGTRDGLWKSSDSGKTWHKTSPHIVKSIAISPVDSKKVYLATQDAGMLYSSDGGETISEGMEGFADRRLNQLVADSRSIYVTGGQDREAWLVPADAMRKGHKAWRALRFPSSMLGQRVSVSTFGLSIYALGGGAIYRSKDQGVNWTRLGSTITAAIGLAVLSDKELIAATSKAIYRSSDAGVTWKPIPLPPSKDTIARIFSTQGSRDFVAETSSGFRIFKDGVANPAKVSIPVRPSEVNDFILEGNVLIASTSRGLYRSPDSGATWQMITKGIDAGTVAGIANTASTLYAAQYGKVFRSQDTGESWQEMTTEGLDEASILRLAVAPSGGLIALTPSRGVFVLEDTHPTQPAAGTSGARIQ